MVPVHLGHWSRFVEQTGIVDPGFFFHLGFRVLFGVFCIQFNGIIYIYSNNEYMGNSGIATMIGVHMHPTIRSSTCNTLVSDYNTPASNAVT
jgi:hypothetical protein